MKTAVILFNLGGPDRPDCVRPFLFNLFNDPAIIRLPAILRTPLAYLIAKRRAKVAGKIYDLLGGGSPLLPNTKAQATALQAALGDRFKCFIVMRYWHPMAGEVAELVKDYNPDRVLLLPLYPQYSTTTTASSVKEWHRAVKAAKLGAPTQLICCYPTLGNYYDKVDGFVRAQIDLIKPFLKKASWRQAESWNAPQKIKPRILFSAHGLPEKIVAGGDPYQWQCEQTAKAIVDQLGDHDLDYVSCYQSRVGPLKWIGPSTEDEIRRAGADGVPLIVVPIAFTSEHSETLVELDIEYAHLAHEAGVPAYHRVPTVSAHSVFIDGLADLVKRTINSGQKICSQAGGRICPAHHGGCPHKS